MDEILIPTSIYAELEEYTKREVGTTGYLFYQPGTKTIIGYYPTGAGASAKDESSTLKEIVAESMATALGLEKIVYHTRPNGSDDFKNLQETIMRKVGQRHMIISKRGALSVTQDFTVDTVVADRAHVAKMEDFKKKIVDFEKHAGLGA
jgi:hypothetical protein